MWMQGQYRTYTSTVTKKGTSIIHLFKQVCQRRITALLGSYHTVSSSQNQPGNVLPPAFNLSFLNDFVNICTYKRTFNAKRVLFTCSISPRQFSFKCNPKRWTFLKSETYQGDISSISLGPKVDNQSRLYLSVISNR